MGPAPSSEAASFCSSSSDWSAVRRIRTRERQPFPRDDDDHREHRPVGEPYDRLKAERPRDPGEQAGIGVHQKVLPYERADRRHDEERRDHHEPQNVLAEHRLIHQESHQNSADDADDEDGNDEDQGIDQSGDEIRVGEERRVILQPDKGAVVGIEQAIAQRRKVERHRQGHDHPDEEQDDRR